MSSDPDSTQESETTSDSNQFSPPSCTFCTKKEKSKSYCMNCKNYLCDRCDFLHGITVRFSLHKVIFLHEVENIDCLEKILNNEDSWSSNTHTSGSSGNVRQNLESLLGEGTIHINSLLRFSCDMKNLSETLCQQHLETINYVNELYRRFQQSMNEQNDQIIQKLDENYNFIHMAIALKHEECDLAINDFVLKLADRKLYMGANGENYLKEVNSSVLPTNDSFQSSLVAAGKHNFEFFSGLNVSTAIDELMDEAAAVNLKKNTFPYDSFTKPVVASEPKNFKCLANLDLTISTTGPDSPPNSNLNTVQIYKTFGQKGGGPSQFNSPHGFCLGLNEDIVVADTGNHRVQIFDKTGCLKSQFGVPGRQDGYLWHPRKVAILSQQRCYVVCDRGYERSRMQIFTEYGKFVKKIYIQYIDIVAGVAVTENEEIVVVNSATPTVFIIGQNDFLRSIDCTAFMEEPSDIVVVGKEFYICDFKAHSVVVIDEDGNFLRKFGGKHMMFPNGIAVASSGYVLIGDSHGNFFHIVVYLQDGTFIAEYRCPYVKVSRCCGLKITNEGRVVTVDKNYHHVIILEALFGS